jgi:tRNA (adenine37-N6)-methyltransferase
MVGSDPPLALTVLAIGVIHSPWTDVRGAPIQPSFAQGVRGQVTLDEAYAEALADIEGFERIWLVYWLDRAGPFRARVTPYLDSQARGLLATRAPCRPNPIGISAVRLLGRRGHTLDVSDLDVLDGTPLLDLKPYVPRFDVWPGRAGWIDEATDGQAVDDGRFAARTARVAGEPSAAE